MTRVPFYVYFVTIATGVYLAIEIAFGVNFVRVFGNNPDADQVHFFEHFGRIMTGVAIALAYVGIRTYPGYYRLGYSFIYSTFQAAIRFAVIIPATFYALDYYGEARGAYSDGQARQQAVVANMIKRLLTNEASTDHSAEFDAFISASTLAFDPDAFLSARGLTLDQLTKIDARTSVGEPNSAYLTFSEQMKKSEDFAFDEYSGSGIMFDQALDNARYDAKDEWEKYMAEMRSRFSRFPAPGSYAHGEVIKRLHSEGLPVPNNFVLSDRNTFIRSYMSKAYAEAEREYDNVLTNAFGKNSGVRKGMSRSQFLASSGFQKAVREKLKLPALRGVILSSSMSSIEFDGVVYPALIKAAEDRALDLVSTAPSAFERGELAKLGEESVKAAVLPATGLLLSLAGALFHIYKLSSYVGFIALRTVSVGESRAVFFKHGIGFASLILALISMQSVSKADTAVWFAPSPDNLQIAALKTAVEVQSGMALIGNAVWVPPANIDPMETASVVKVEPTAMQPQLLVTAKEPDVKLISRQVAALNVVPLPQIR